MQSTTDSPAPRLIRHPVVVIDEFLPGPEWQTLLSRVLASEAQFVPSGTHDRRSDYRQSLVLNPPADLVHPVVSRVRAAMPQVVPALRVPPIEVGLVEAQVTASVHGSFFGVHTDHGVEVRKRHLTFVYYFNRQPKGFAGGELRVYDDVVRNGKLARAESFSVIEPCHNRIVFFWARTMHEVMRVDVASRAFADARFTVNGWVNQA